MNLQNSDISYSIELLRKHIPELESCEIKNHEKFSAGVEGKIGNVKLTFGKMPSGRYVFLSSWAVYSLKQFI